MKPNAIPKSLHSSLIFMVKAEPLMFPKSLHCFLARQETYIWSFLILKDLQPEVKPEDVIMNFEMALYNGFIAFFRYVSITFCFFHKLNYLQKRSGVQ